MRHGQIVAFGLESRLGEKLRTWAEGHGLNLRGTQQPQACLNLLRKGGAGPLVLRLSRNLERELALLRQVSWLLPDIGTIVVGTADNPSLGKLAQDLGAACVLLPLGSLAELETVLAGWLPGNKPIHS